MAKNSIQATFSALAFLSGELNLWHFVPGIVTVWSQEFAGIAAACQEIARRQT